MSNTVIKVENVSKQYRLGVVGTGTISSDLTRWWARVRGKEDPFLKIGETNDRSTKGTSDYVWALRDVNFDVKQGDVVGVIGKNGAGKSTLLKIMSQVTSPTTGQVKVKGRIASLLEVGTGFNPDLTGRDNVFLNGAILGMTKQEIKRKFDEIIDFSGVERYIDTPVKRYSSGMYVRLAFAVAAHLDPEILIVDEVLAVGDAEFQKKCLGKMKDVSGQGRTVLFVSHNMAAVKTLCTSGIILKNGSMVYSGDVESACSIYLSGNQSGDEFKDRTDRTGNGKMRINDLYFTDAKGNKVTTLISGDFARLNMSFTRKPGETIKNLFLGITIKNEMEVVQTVIATDEMGLNLNTEKQEGVFEVELEKIMLRGGAYSITFQISDKASTMANHEILDRVESALLFNVERGDYWGVGNINRKNGYLQDAKILVKDR